MAELMRSPILAGGVKCTAGFLAGAAIVLLLGTDEHDSRHGRRHAGEEVVMVFLSSASCAYCADAQLPGLVTTIRDSIRAKAAARDLQFSTLGVGIDPIPEQAISQLARFGLFDELSVGSRWTNLGALRYALDEFPGSPEVPQIVVARRELRGKEGQVDYVAKESVLARHVGLAELARWVSRGVPVRLDQATLLGN